MLARSLITGRSRIIGLVVAFFEHHFYPEALQIFSNALQQKGYHILIFMASKTAGNIDDVVEEILDYQVDGIIAASVAMSSHLAAQCNSAGVPVVLFTTALKMMKDCQRSPRLMFSVAKKLPVFL